MVSMKFSSKCLKDLVCGKADYIREGILHFNSIKIDNECLAFLVNGQIVASLEMPKNINFSCGDSATIELTDGMISVKIEAS